MTARDEPAVEELRAPLGRVHQVLQPTLSLRTRDRQRLDNEIN